MRSVFFDNKKLLLLTFFTVILSLNNVHARKIELAREGNGITVKNNITNAIEAAVQTNDTIYIIGSDIDTFTGDFPQNFYNGNITFLGKNPNPDSFPVLIIRGTNWNHFWNNVGNCTTRLRM